MQDDIRPIIDDWPYRTGRISVRKIVGADGGEKIQMRLDLGLIQMEPTGRPDGRHPKGFDTLLEYYLDQLAHHEQQHQTDMSFELSPADCRQIREEALLYYHRYLACFVLEDYEQVIRDTQRNLQAFDLCNKYASKKSDRMDLEQYRPYVIMMNTRAKTQLATKCGRYGEALRHIRAGLRAIKRIYVDSDQPEGFKSSLEASLLRDLGKTVRKKLPSDPVKSLKKQLRRAVAEERFEDAARIRNRLEKLERSNRRHHQED